MKLLSLCALAMLTASLVPSSVRAQCGVAAPPTVVGRRASLVAPLVLTPQGDRTAVGWVVPSDNPGRNDDAAAIVLGPDLAVVATLDREEPLGGGQFESPIHRVSPVVRGGAFAVHIDQTENGELDDRFTICGEHQSLFIEGSRAGAGSHRIHLDATAQCRLLAPERPLVVGARAEAPSQSAPNGVLRLLAGDDRARTLQPLSWSLPLRGDFMARAFADARRTRPNEPPTLTLRLDGDFIARETAVVSFLTETHALEGLQAVRVGDVGWYVVFRFGEALYGGWIDPSLQAVGALAPITSSPMRAGLPTVATDGRDAVIVHAGRSADDAPWTLMVERVPPRGVASAPQPLAIAPPPRGHLFAPSIAPLPNGWAVGYSVGPLRGSRRARDRQHVWLAALDPRLAVRGAPVRVSNDAGGSDGRILSRGSRVQVVYMGGQDGHRSVRATSATCN